MKALGIIFFLINISILTGCHSFINSRTLTEQNIVPIFVQIGNEVSTSTAYKIQDMYITTAHSIGDDLSSIEIKNTKNCRVQSKDSERDIAWILCGESKNFQKVYPDSATQGEHIQVGVYREGKLQFLTGAVIDPSAYIGGIDTQGSLSFLSGVVLTDIDFLPGDSGSPIFSLKTNKWIGIVHTQ